MNKYSADQVNILRAKWAIFENLSDQALNNFLEHLEQGKSKDFISAHLQRNGFERSPNYLLKHVFNDPDFFKKHFSIDYETKIGKLRREASRNRSNAAHSGHETRKRLK